MAAELLLLTGSPGCGKTTVAPLVADQTSPSACFDLDWFFAKLRKGALEPWRTEAHPQNRTVMAAAAAAVTEVASGRYFTVAEGIIFPLMLDLFTEACMLRSVTLSYAVLRAPLVVAQQRVQSRTTEPEHFGALADEKVVESLWTMFEDGAIDERHRVDAGDRSPAAVANEIFHRCVDGEFRL